MAANLRPIPDAPALLLAPKGRGRPLSLVVADLHLGLGGSAAAPGGPPEGSPETLSARVTGLAEEYGARRVIVAGDAKHPIVGTPPPLRPIVFDFFSRLLAERLAVDLVLGNHDVGLVPFLPREVRVVPASGLLVEGVGIFHGHRWPAAPVLRARKLVTGHLHPGFRFAPTSDHPDGKRRGWVRVEFEPGALTAPGRRSRVRGRESPTRELVVLPAFNPLAGTEALNRDHPRRGRSFLFRRFLSRGIARGYLLDGTDVGRLVTPDGESGAEPAARRARPDR